MSGHMEWHGAAAFMLATMRDWASGRPLLRVPESCAGRAGEDAVQVSAFNLKLVPVAVALLSRPKKASGPLLGACFVSHDL